METWKQITGYEGLYEVSDKGRVRTSEGKITLSKRHGQRVWKVRVLKQKSDRRNYKRVNLYKDKKQKSFLVHRLVAMSFCENKENRNIVNHIDGNPANNESSNLEWVNYLENSKHAFENGLMNTNKRITLIDKTTKEKIVFYSMAECSRFLGRNKGYISGIIKRGKEEIDNYLISLPF